MLQRFFAEQMILQLNNTDKNQEPEQTAAVFVGAVLILNRNVGFSVISVTENIMQEFLQIYE